MQIKRYHLKCPGNIIMKYLGVILKSGCVVACFGYSLALLDF